MHPQPESTELTESKIVYKISRSTPNVQFMSTGLHFLKIKQPSKTLTQIEDLECKHMSPWGILHFQTKTLAKLKI